MASSSSISTSTGEGKSSREPSRPRPQPQPQRPPHLHRHRWGGWKATFGCARRSLALYRISVGAALFVELALRFKYLRAFYSEEGTHPMRLLRPQIDDVYSTLCLHCKSDALLYQRLLLSVQCVLALCLAVGYKTRIAAMGSWFLYLSLTLRNTWLAFILDRYFHYLTFYAMLLPLGGTWSLDEHLRRRRNDDDDDDGGDGGRSRKGEGGDDDTEVVVSVATVALKLQILWIYLDAGYGKYSDPLGGWSLTADPLPALDTYARHTVAARYLYALLGPTGLRYMTPTVVYVELCAAPMALLCSWWGWADGVWGCVGVVWSLHFGIAMTVRNTALLSSVANCAWCAYLPPAAPPLPAPAPPSHSSPPAYGAAATSSSGPSNGRGPLRMSAAFERVRRDGSGGAEGSGGSATMKKHLPSVLLVAAFVSGSVWFEVFSGQCDQSMKHVWSTLLHNRWNVFVGAEEYVTWEIAPGRLSDGTIVDVWSKNLNGVEWDMPGTGAPCTSTARAGRWRSFPYLADFASTDGTEESEALWGYLCREWNEENDSGGGDGGRRLVRYNFFMLQADVLPNMGFSATRKRLIHSHECARGEGEGRRDAADAADEGRKEL